MSTTTANTVIRTDVVRVICLVVPKEGLNFEDFDEYWLNWHGPLFASLSIVKKNLIKYEQFHFHPEGEDKLIDGGVPVTNVRTPYGGMATFEAESYEKITAIFTDPEYLERVVPDEKKFCDMEKCVWIGGGVADVINKRSQAGIQ